LHASVGFAFFGLLAALSVGTMAIAQTADGIRGFESETGGVDLCVAGGLIDIGPVFLKLVARCWRSRLIEHAVHHPHPALDGWRGSAVGGDLLDGGVAGQAAA
jgi:hypothetical protein